MKKQKFYVVWLGRKPGIYKTWESCREQVDKFVGAAYKAFESMDEAQKAFAREAKYSLYKNKAKTKKTKDIFGGDFPDMKSISVDAAWNTKTKIMEYQGVYTATGEKVFVQGPFYDATNNIGEFLAIVHAIALLKQKKSKLPVYSDSMTAIKWVTDKKANTKLIETPDNKELFDLIDRAEMWLKQNTYTNGVIKWNTKSWGEIPADFGRK